MGAGAEEAPPVTVRQRQPRLLDAGYLAFLREKPCCCGCNRPPRSEAAHIRIGLFAKHMKPHDKDAVPLNAWCHRLAPDAQHQDEIGFWERRGIDPFDIAARLYAEYGGTGGAPKRKRTKIRPRLPKERRAKIASRPFGKQKRSFGR